MKSTKIIFIFTLIVLFLSSCNLLTRENSGNITVQLPQNNLQKTRSLTWEYIPLDSIKYFTINIYSANNQLIDTKKANPGNTISFYELPKGLYKVAIEAYINTDEILAPRNYQYLIEDNLDDSQYIEDGIVAYGEDFVFVEANKTSYTNIIITQNSIENIIDISVESKLNIDITDNEYLGPDLIYEYLDKIKFNIKLNNNYSMQICGDGIFNLGVDLSFDNIYDINNQIQEFFSKETKYITLLAYIGKDEPIKIKIDVDINILDNPSDNPESVFPEEFALTFYKSDNNEYYSIGKTQNNDYWYLQRIQSNNLQQLDGFFYVNESSDTTLTNYTKYEYNQGLITNATTNISSVSETIQKLNELYQKYTLGILDQTYICAFYNETDISLPDVDYSIDTNNYTKNNYYIAYDYYEPTIGDAWYNEKFTGLYKFPFIRLIKDGLSFDTGAQKQLHLVYLDDNYLLSVESGDNDNTNTNNVHWTITQNDTIDNLKKYVWISTKNDNLYDSTTESYDPYGYIRINQPTYTIGDISVVVTGYYENNTNCSASIEINVLANNQE